ncbi:hypothetical protein ISF6_1401 [Piscinibacter sakaiensis]|uniref:Uncharacterized protein n=1 Tax=Piscinibacter sakaiensis TaxID=1547922 RepID=A0A0K8NZ17_PISS1|nr:hypothetical protein ISF6_1401 [Piscinibacter sakaiensis]
MQRAQQPCGLVAAVHDDVLAEVAGSDAVGDADRPVDAGAHRAQRPGHQRQHQRQHQADERQPRVTRARRGLRQLGAQRRLSGLLGREDRGATALQRHRGVVGLAGIGQRDGAVDLRRLQLRHDRLQQLAVSGQQAALLRDQALQRRQLRVRGAHRLAMAPDLGGRLPPEPGDALGLDRVRGAERHQVRLVPAQAGQRFAQLGDLRGGGGSLVEQPRDGGEAGLLRPGAPGTEGEQRAGHQQRRELQAAPDAQRGKTGRHGGLRWGDGPLSDRVPAA